VNGGNPENPSGLLSQQALPRPQKIRADDQGRGDTERAADKQTASLAGATIARSTMPVVIGLPRPWRRRDGLYPNVAAHTSRSTLGRRWRRTSPRVVRFARCWISWWSREKRRVVIVMDRSKVKIMRMSDAPEVDFVEGSIAERIAMVWEITCDVWSMTGAFDAESRLRRDVVHLHRP
jgi:hypothetical protein